MASSSKRKAVADDVGSSTRKRKKGKTNELGLILNTSSDMSRYNNHLYRDIALSRYPDEFTLLKLGIENNVMTLLHNIGWTQFIGTKYYTHKKVTIEFLSTITFIKDKDNPQVKFSFSNNEFNMSLTEFNTKMGFASEGLIHTSRNKDINPEDYDPHEFWSLITGRNHFESRSAKASMIHNPVFRYVHRVMACTIFGRPKTGTVRSDELYLLWAMVNSRTVNTGWYLLNHLAFVGGQAKGTKMAVGGVIEFIKRKITGQVEVDEDDRYIDGNYFVDIDYLKNIHMIKEKEGYPDNFQLMIGNEPSIVLPDSSRTDTTKWDNWLYNDVVLQVPQQHHAQGEHEVHHPQDEAQHEDMVHDDHDDQQPPGGMQDDGDWRVRMESKMDKFDSELLRQSQMMFAMMQHFNIQAPPSD